MYGSVSRTADVNRRPGSVLTRALASDENATNFDGGVNVMERIGVGTFDVELSEPVRFWIKSALFLFSTAVLLFVALAASYPAVHDTLHNFRHALAIVPCH